MLGARRPVAIGGCLGNNAHDLACNTEFADYLDHVFADSADAAEALERQLVNRNIGITAIPHGVHSRPASVPREFTGRLHLVFVGRHVAVKRIPDMLQVACHLRSAGVKFQFTLAGDGPLRAALEREAGDLGLLECVSFPGFLPQEQLDALMASGHLNFLLSESEGFGLSVLEGMQFGCVPIVTDTCGCKRAIHDGINGFVVTLGDVAAAAGHVRQLDQDRVMLARMSEQAARTAREDYSVEKEMKHHLEVLRVAREHHRRYAAETVAWTYKAPSLINHPIVPNWLASRLRTLKHQLTPATAPVTKKA